MEEEDEEEDVSVFVGFSSSLLQPVGLPGY